MKFITPSRSLLLGLLTLAVFLHSRPAVGNPPLEESPSQARVNIAEIKESIAEVTDPMLREALSELLDNALKHTPPQKGESHSDEVLRICRSSQRVYCNFMGFQATHTDQSIKVTKKAIKAVYDVALSRISWVTERRGPQDDLAKAYASIKDKHDKMALSSVAAK